MSRSLQHLQPIVDAETARGNPPLGRGWQLVTTRDGSWLEMHFRYPLDSDAIKAEFVLPDGVWAERGQAGSRPASARMLSTGKLARGQAKRNASWWERWRAGPQTRTELPPTTVDGFDPAKVAEWVSWTDA